MMENDSVSHAPVRSGANLLHTILTDLRLPDSGRCLLFDIFRCLVDCIKDRSASCSDEYLYVAAMHRRRNRTTPDHGIALGEP